MAAAAIPSDATPQNPLRNESTSWWSYLLPRLTDVLPAQRPSTDLEITWGIEASGMIMNGGRATIPAHQVNDFNAFVKQASATRTQHRPERTVTFASACERGTAQTTALEQQLEEPRRPAWIETSKLRRWILVGRQGSVRLRERSSSGRVGSSFPTGHARKTSSISPADLSLRAGRRSSSQATSALTRLRTSSPDKGRGRIEVIRVPLASGSPRASVAWCPAQRAQRSRSASPRPPKRRSSSRRDQTMS